MPRVFLTLLYTEAWLKDSANITSVDTIRMTVLLISITGRGRGVLVLLDGREGYLADCNDRTFERVAVQLQSSKQRGN